MHAIERIFFDNEAYFTARDTAIFHPAITNSIQPVEAISPLRDDEGIVLPVSLLSGAYVSVSARWIAMRLHSDDLP